MARNRPTIVAISGFSSNVGKTTLMCELLHRLPGWEAIKVTRGHSHSRDAHTEKSPDSNSKAAKDWSVRAVKQITKPGKTLDASGTQALPTYTG